MEVTCEIKEYSKEFDTKTVKIHSVLFEGNMVEIEFNDTTCKVSAEELKSAIDRATLNCFGR